MPEVLEGHGFGRRKPKVAEKLMRVVDTAAFLTALLGHDSQNIFWMTDNDSILEPQDSSQAHERVLALFQNLLEKYKRVGVNFAKIGGAAPFTDENALFGDLFKRYGCGRRFAVPVHDEKAGRSRGKGDGQVWLRSGAAMAD